MSVLVTDGNQRATLAVVRALGSCGISTIVGEETIPTLAGCSRYCTASLRYPSPREDGQGFQDFLLSEVRSGKYRVLIPMTDVTLQLVSQIREGLSSHVALPIPCHKAITLSLDKRYLLRLADELNIPFPATFMMDENEDLDEAASVVQYPAVIKPRFSRFFDRGVWTEGRVLYARDPADLVAKYRASHAQIPFPLVQNYVEGEGLGVFLCLWNGKLKCVFCHRRLREKPPWGGPSVYRESIPFDAELVDQSRALLDALGWQGVAMVEFKLDRKDGRAKLMEINGRFWGSLQLALDAGINFPQLLYRLALGEDVPSQLRWKAGVKSRWFLGDLDHLLIRLRHAESPDGLPAPTTSRVRACLDFLKIFEADVHHEVLRLDDPAPGWFEVKSYLRDSTRRLFSRSVKGHAH